MDDPVLHAVEADRWLAVHRDRLVGRRTAEAVDLVRQAGLLPHVAAVRGAPPDPGVPDPGRIRLLVGDDDRVRRAKWG
ncbi:hypothetical protein [Amnibacterium kyonggiense]|uniref:Uncharacterized protein n=1 Tax=Amnibacterium kyonggiense TaxID=595671 RepID=A0A4R7FIG2_9MICO|nr:hypothetical protein [Amnibacterium kyonggiense]TDS75901.1 hypothetical protein CLV52_3011 [Amnibacterium kyonggiense]